MPDFSFEMAKMKAGYKIICGIDEAGRGPWAGPVIAAAAVIDSALLSPEVIAEIDDSKKLNKPKREALFARFGNGIWIGIGHASVEEIDTINILQATMLAMKRATANITIVADFALVDGNRTPDLGGVPAEYIIKGDGKSVSIAAASIAAKVTRDQIMTRLSDQYPGYGWERNAGYGTRQHQMALSELGVTPVHRKSFAPIRKILGQVS